jgi:predicted methyltransferase
MRFGLTLLLALAFSGAAGAQSISTNQIKAIVAAPDRTAADRTNDKRRHP